MRTRPFATPLNATGTDGVYLDCRLVSDTEADRRMWKMTVRTDTSRGEMVYQAEYNLQAAMDDARKYSTDGENGDAWARVLVPFDKFQLVRGPRLIPDGPRLDVTGGIFQIGMTLSKFMMAQNTTELENFRPGFFNMHIRRIGFYNNSGAAAATASAAGSTVATVPDTLSKEEAEKKRPLLLKVLLPVAKLFFSEKANRRRSAMRILREDREMGRGRAILFGVRCRMASMGVVPSLFKAMGILAVDALRTVVLTCLKVAVLYPVRVAGKFVTIVKKALGMKVKPPLRE